MENNESFASPKEETKEEEFLMHHTCEHCGFECQCSDQPCSCCQEETPASKEKPDFEKMFAKKVTEVNAAKILIKQQHEQIAALQEEIRQLKEHSQKTFKMVERTIVSGNYDTTTGENLELLSIHLRKLKNK